MVYLPIQLSSPFAEGHEVFKIFVHSYKYFRGSEIVSFTASALICERLVFKAPCCPATIACGIQTAISFDDQISDVIRIHSLMRLIPDYQGSVYQAIFCRAVIRAW